MDRQDINFSKYDVHYLITDFEVNEEQLEIFLIESFRNLMDSHKQACVNQHGHCRKSCAMIVLQLINSPSDGWPPVNRWVSPSTVAHLTAKPPVIAELNELLPKLNQKFSERARFRTTTLVDLTSDVYLDFFQGGNSSRPDKASRAHTLRDDLRDEWKDRLLRCINFLKLRGHD